MANTIELYPFQVEDRDKALEVEGFLDGSEMGTGKTYVAAAICEARSPEGNKLWVGPMGTHSGIETKIKQVNPEALVVRVDPKSRHEAYRTFRSGAGGYFLVHWEALRLMPELAEDYWSEIVADECHRMQNRKAQQTQALKRTTGAHRIAMSGTPVTGDPDKYWSTLSWLYKRQYTSYWKFFKQYVDFEITPQGYRKVKGPKNEDQLLEQMQPFYSRHLKRAKCCEHHPEGVMPWLPDKYYDPVYVDLYPEQRRAYEEMKKELIAWVGEHQHQPIVAPVVVAQMMRLQQFACAYAAEIDGILHLTEPSSKVDAVMGILQDNPEEPIVVFSQFNKLLRLIQDRCTRAGIKYSLYTGQNRSDREDDKERFIDGNTRVFIGNISAGGVGLDGLQRISSTVIFCDRLWSPALNQQAEDRLWRDGQANAVQVIDIIANSTVDLGRRQRLELKWDWIQRLLGDK